MSRVAYINGRYEWLQHAVVPIYDRGYNFADGVYEVIAFFDEKCVDLLPHLERLDHSMHALDIHSDMSHKSLEIIIRQIIQRNRIRNGAIYLQVTRGTNKRNHVIPKDILPNFLISVLRISPPSQTVLDRGVRVITTPDIRWQRCDIKSIALLPNVLVKDKAKQEKAGESWMVDENGYITEGSSSNAYIITKGNVLLTHPEGNKILAGITRSQTLECAKKLGIKVAERPFTVKEAQQAKEAFLTSTTQHILPVRQINDTPIGDGNVGETVKSLMAAYQQYIQAQIHHG